MSINTRLCPLLKILNDTMVSKLNADLSKLNVTFPQTEILIFLHYCYTNDVEVNQIDIEKAFNLSNPTVTGMLKRLEKSGFVVREKSATDGRYKIVQLTEKGLDITLKMASAGDTAEAMLFAGFTKEEKQLLNQFIARMLKNLDVDVD
ncbi:MAG: MarR family winged helix-turn-helix transcriptional regulator [Anaerotignaceae bacterium]